MPIITIKTPYPTQQLCLKSMAKEISVTTDIDPGRFNIFIEQYIPCNFYNEDGNQPVIVHVAASIHNGKQTIQTIMAAAANTIKQQLSIEDNQIAVYSHPIEDGYLLVHNRFK